jgi:hypothetical protein
MIPRRRIDPGVRARNASSVSSLAPVYRPPQLLRDVQLLDLLELTGSTQQASRHLAISQPSVSRRYQRLARDFGLRREPRRRFGCRFGSNGSIRYLRLAAREHRIAAGLAALGCDLLHRPLLEGIEGLLLPPSRFLPAADWGHLLREGVVDAVLLPALEFEDGEIPGHGVQAVELGWLPLAMLAPQPAADEQPEAAVGSDGGMVLAPSPEQAPGLVRLLTSRGLALQWAPSRVRDWDGWLALRRPRGPRLVVPGPLAPSAGPVPPLASGDLRERLWLLVAEDLSGRGMEECLLASLRRGLLARTEGPDEGQLRAGPSGANTPRARVSQ